MIDTVMDDRTSLEEECVRKDELERLRRVVRDLKPEEFQLLKVMYLGDWVRTEQEAAKELGVSRDIIKRRKKKLFFKIQKFLRPKS